MSAPRGGGGAGDPKKRSRYPQADVQGGGGGYSNNGNNNSSMSLGGSSSSSSSQQPPQLPRTLHVLEFAEARAREIASLTHILAAGGGGGTATAGLPGQSGGNNPAQISGGGRRVFQSLPRHMRRRAMSHNIKRLPLRLQGAAKREMDKIARSAPAASAAGGGGDGDSKPSGSKAPSRRTRRRPRNILALHAHRMGKHQWLETHIWHAKRMKMSNCWGYKMALNPTDRSLRACYNAGVHLATAYDASFMQVLAVLAQDAAAIIELLRPFLPPSDLALLQQGPVLAGREETRVRLHVPGAHPYGFIAHAKCQWQPAAAPNATAERQLWLWIHPSVYALLQSLLETAAASASVSATTAGASGVRVQPLLGELCRIEMRGYRCQAVMRMVIRAIEQQQLTAAATATKAESKEDTEMSDVAASSSSSSSAPVATTPPTTPSIAALLALYSSPALFPAHAIYSLRAQHPDRLKGGPGTQPFSLSDATREKQRGPITPKRGGTFSKENEIGVLTQMKKEHHEALYHQAATTATTSATAASTTASASAPASGALPSASPLFDASFRRAHTRETLWGAKKQRYTRIALKDSERKRRMHERRADQAGSVAAAAANAADSGDEAGAASDTTPMRRRKQPPPSSAKKGSKPAAVRSKDDLDVGSSSTSLPLSSSSSSSPSAPLVAALSGQPEIMLIQQPGGTLQGSSGAPKLQVNSATQSLGSGWDIVCGAGWGVLIWKALVYAGARAIGRSERARFQHELQRLDEGFSPEDDPDSHAGQAALLFIRRCARWHSDRIPANKKPNYQLNHVAHPFGAPFVETLELATQDEIEKNYEACIDKPDKESRRYERNLLEPSASEDEEEEQKDEENSAPRKKAKLSAAAGERKDAAADVAMEDTEAKATPAATVAASAAATSVSSRKAKRKTKRLPLPETEPPFELLPIPASFSSSHHLPFYVWRSWREDWDAARARAQDPSMSLVAFLSSSAAPPLFNVLLAVSLKSPSGGLPEDHALLCAPRSDEWKRFLTQTPAATLGEDPTAAAALTHNERNAKPQPWDVMMERTNKQQQPHPLRPTIGHLTHGWFSYQAGSGVGLGFVAAQPFVRLMQEQHPPLTVAAAPASPPLASPAVWVWCRNTNSLAYRAAQLQLL